MKTRQTLCAVTCIALLTLLHSISFGQLYSQDFDVDDSANWNINPGNGIDLGTATPLPLDTNFDLDGNGTVDDTSDIFFDYSSVGIPSAPNSTGGTTRGMKLQANLTSNAFGGFSVSPTGQSFVGSYKLSYDIWSNYVGNLNINADPPDAPAPGQTNLSYAGILTAGNVSNSPGFGNVDGVWFAHTANGDSGADYRVYSPDRDVSYQAPPQLPIDNDATHHAGTRNHLGQLYTDNFGGVSAPAAQLALFPSQTGATLPGVAGMEWHEAEIEKIGDAVTWKMDGVLLITLDISNFTIPTGGNNILFGHTDVNQASSPESLSETLLFTLIDNVVVEAVPEPRSLLLLGMGALGLATIVSSREPTRIGCHIGVARRDRNRKQRLRVRRSAGCRPSGLGVGCSRALANNDLGPFRAWLLRFSPKYQWTQNTAVCASTRYICAPIARIIETSGYDKQL